VTFRQSLLQLLEADPPHEEELLAEFESHRHEGYPLYSSILYILCHLNFPEAEAQRHWRRILAHRDRLRARLGRDAGLRVAILDYFVNVSRELKNPMVIEISIYEHTERSAITDGLTGLYNHTYFLQILRQEVLRCKRHELKMSVALFDLDDFKKLNDHRGHVEGDRILMKTAALIKDSLREIDVPARYGGEEFAVILPETAGTGAYVVAERVRVHVEEHFRRRKGVAGVTLSGGIATYPNDATNPEDLIGRADEGLYRSKAAGKNRITLVRGDRRRHARMPASHPVTLGARGRKALARSKNVSDGGLLVSLKEPVAVGSAVSVVIRARAASPVDLRGEVVRVQRVTGRQATWDVGVRLIVDPSSDAALRGLKSPSPPSA
jgi:diguanylate cyclase (GGDEF)-like protein